AEGLGYLIEKSFDVAGAAAHGGDDDPGLGDSVPGDVLAVVLENRPGGGLCVGRQTAGDVETPPQTGDFCTSHQVPLAVGDEEPDGVGADVDGGLHGRGDQSGLRSSPTTQGTTQSSGSIQPATRSPTGLSLPAAV